MTIKQKEKKHFNIIERRSLSQKLTNKIIKQYTDTDNTKFEASIIASRKYGRPITECKNILSSIPHKPRFEHKNHPIKRIEAQGGLDLIKAFKRERWTLGEMSTYFKVSPSTLRKYLTKYNMSLRELSFREEITDEDANWVKNKYGIK